MRGCNLQPGFVSNMLSPVIKHLENTEIWVWLHACLVGSDPLCLTHVSLLSQKKHISLSRSDSRCKQDPDEIDSVWLSTEPIEGQS